MKEEEEEEEEEEFSRFTREIVLMIVNFMFVFGVAQRHSLSRFTISIERQLAPTFNLLSS
jgi:hypothetical protein